MILAFTPEDISKKRDAAESFISSLVDDFRNKRWTRILSLAGVLSILFLNPIAISIGLNFLHLKPPNWGTSPSYLYVWLIVTSSFFVSAFIVVLLTKKWQEPGTEATTISIIKGLLPYTKEDAEWFAKLQRQDILHECMNFCLGSDSSLGILSGESGAGKTSFLQAGLSPNLEKQGQCPYYVKFTDSPPLDTIRQSLSLTAEEPTSEDSQSLINLLRRAIQDDGRPVVLILDQFEQFFAHNKTKPSRKLFIQQMAEWNKQRGSLPIKILISIRGDFADRLTEFQKEMEYTLTLHSNLRLEKFEPREAASVIGVIAREAKIELDEDFVKEMTKHELANREDGTVSPVDIQIFSWMIDGQKSSEERAFNRKAFQKLGGVEGLLERFLNRALNARETDARRQSAIKVMLALTDQNVRAGALSLKNLKEKLKEVVPDSDIEEAVSWLARGEVRLITSIQQKNVMLYELAHERLIPSLRRLTFKEITDVEKAQQNLDRRVNEWIGNNRSQRYLLTLREWRTIKRYSALIILGPQKDQKKEFVSLSKRRFVKLGVSYTAISFLGLGGYVGYRSYERSRDRQMHYAKTRLTSLLRVVTDPDATKDAALLLDSIGAEDKELSDAIWKSINRRTINNRLKVLSPVVKAYGQLGQWKKEVELFKQLPRSVELPIDERVVLFASVAKAYCELGQLKESLD
jgi:hypothetical protein